MKRKVIVFLFIVVLGTLVACTKQEEPITEVPDLEPLTVELTVTEAVEIGETVDMNALVTMGDEKIEDADEVVFEVWEEGQKADSEMIDAVNEEEGIYTAETSFDYDGVFHIQVHVTDCLNYPPGEIVVPVKMPVTRNKTERPHGASLQFNIGFRYFMYRIGGRLGNCGASHSGVTLGIPPLKYWNSNLRP